MNEELQLTVNDILVKAIEAFNKGSDWLAGEVPEVIEQLLLWHFWESLLGFVAGWVATISITALGVYAIKKTARDRANKKPWTLYYSDPVTNTTSLLHDIVSPLAIAVIPIAWIFAILLTLINGAPVWLQILVAPKLYLLEYAADLVK